MVSPRTVEHEPREIRPGGSTAAGGVVAYRLGKLAAYASVTGRWLDCGCCDGEYTLGLSAVGAADVVGADVDPARVRAAARAPGRARFVAAAAEALPFADGSFSGVLLNEVLEHVVDQRRTLAELARVLAPGGWLIVFSPNRWFPFEGHGMVAGRVNVPFPVPLLPWLPRRLALPLMKARNYWPGELRDLVAAAGFEVRAVDFAFPLFGHYRWLPAPIVRHYRKALPRLERMPVLRRLGVSTLVVARRPLREQS